MKIYNCYPKSPFEKAETGGGAILGCSKGAEIMLLICIWVFISFIPGTVSRVSTAMSLHFNFEQTWSNLKDEISDNFLRFCTGFFEEISRLFHKSYEGSSWPLGLSATQNGKDAAERFSTPQDLNPRLPTHYDSPLPLSHWFVSIARTKQCLSYFATCNQFFCVQDCHSLIVQVEYQGQTSPGHQP